MKAQLIFNLDDPDDRDSHQMAVKARDMTIALSEIRMRMFRPSRKHGFNDEYLNQINDANPELFAKLETMFNEICEEYDVMEYT
jgi:hypothetical protein